MGPGQGLLALCGSHGAYFPQTELASEGVLADLVTMFLGSLRLGRPTPPRATGGRRRDPGVHSQESEKHGFAWEMVPKSRCGGIPRPK